MFDDSRICVIKLANIITQFELSFKRGRVRKKQSEKLSQVQCNRNGIAIAELNNSTQVNGWWNANTYKFEILGNQASRNEFNGLG